MKNDVRIERVDHLKKHERVQTADLEQFIRQHPAKRFLGTNFYVWLYNTADTTKDNGWNRFKRRIGKAPVLLDSTLTERSASAMQIYMNGRGFLDASASFRVDTAKRKARMY